MQDGDRQRSLFTVPVHHSPFFLLSLQIMWRQIRYAKSNFPSHPGVAVIALISVFSQLEPMMQSKISLELS